MREIKFRYVCKEVDGRIFTFITTIRDLEQAKLNINTYGRIDEIVARNQYTDLHAKKGREIYEGDKVGWANPDIFGIVKFGFYDNGECYENEITGNGWYLEVYNKRTKKTYISRLDYYAKRKKNLSCKVIGNIYENEAK